VMRELVIQSFLGWQREGEKTKRLHPFADPTGPSYLGVLALQTLSRAPTARCGKTRAYLAMTSALALVPHPVVRRK